MDDLLDVRSINKNAFTMLKSSVSVDKSIYHTYRTRVKAVPSDYSHMSYSEGTESVDTESIYAPLTCLAHRPSSVKDAHFIQMRNAKNDDVNKKIWDVFKAYEVGPGDIAFDSIETAIPVERLAEALESLYLCNVFNSIRSGIEAMQGLFQANSMLTFHEFKEFVQYVILLEQGSPHKRVTSNESITSASYNHSISAPDSFGNLVQKQRLVSAVVLDDLVDVASVSQTSANLRLGGKLMNSSVLSDAVVKVLNEDDRSRRSKKKGKLQRKHSIASFNDSQDDVDISALDESKDENDPTVVVKRKVNLNPTTAMQKTKVAGLMNSDEEYYRKWSKMKQKRDERLEREFKKKVRQDMMYSFTQIVNRSNKNESLRAQQDVLHYKKAEEDQNRTEAQKRRQILENGLKNRLTAELNRKRNEARYIRETLRTSSEIARQMHQEERELKLSKSVSAPFELDASSSTIINIPTNLITRVKTAKSLLAYEAAKKEIKSFYENTLTERINTFSKSKEFAVKRAAQFGTPLSVSSLEGEYFFDDSICDDSDSESMAIKEYFKHRGRQGKILEEDSMLLPPINISHNSTSHNTTANSTARSGQMNTLSAGIAGLSF